MGIFSKREIESCTLMGVTNQCVDYKLHAILNYQEDIYANVYSFYVKYTDGTAETVQVYQQSEVDYYMSFCKTDKPANTNTTSTNKLANNSSIYDDLLKLEQLHEKGIIPTDLFETQKEELLKQLSATNETKEIIETTQEPKDNIVIIRAVPRPRGAAQTCLYIDNKYQKNNLDKDIIITLPLGEHSIYFKWGIYKSEVINLNIKDNSIHRIRFTNGKNWGISAIEI